MNYGLYIVTSIIFYTSLGVIGKVFIGRYRLINFSMWIQWIAMIVSAAAFNNHVECLQLLLRQSACADIPDNQGQTPLMMAAKHGHSNAVGE